MFYRIVFRDGQVMERVKAQTLEAWFSAGIQDHKPILDNDYRFTATRLDE
jgi:hypothetical protein